MSQNTCDTCSHRHEGECRRYPPQVSVVMIPVKGNVLNPQTHLQPTPVASFPQVAPEIWCAEWAGAMTFKPLQ